MRRESRHEVIETLRRRYLGAKRAEKGRLIEQAVELTGYDRQYARRLLRRGVPTKRLDRPRPERARTYKHRVIDAVAVAAEATGWICSKRLVATLPALIPALENEGALSLSPVIRAQVLALSPATVDRRLADERRTHRPRAH